MKLMKILGYVWVSPLTLIGLLHVCVLSSLGYYKWLGIKGDALVWIVTFAGKSKHMPSFLTKAWERRVGHTIGQVVVLKHPPSGIWGETIMKHEQAHVNQNMRLGILQPFFYATVLVCMTIACKNSSSRYDNPFEIDARRAAGQIIDVVSVIKKLRSK